MQGADVYGVLKPMGATLLHHANSVTTSTTFLEQGGLVVLQRWKVGLEFSPLRVLGYFPVFAPRVKVHLAIESGEIQRRFSGLDQVPLTEAGVCSQISAIRPQIYTFR
jgi:hypothetical protein